MRAENSSFPNGFVDIYVGYLYLIFETNTVRTLSPLTNKVRFPRNNYGRPLSTLITTSLAIWYRIHVHGEMDSPMQHADVLKVHFTLQVLAGMDVTTMEARDVIVEFNISGYPTIVYFE